MGYHGMRGGSREHDQRATDWQYSGNLWHEPLGYVEVRGGVEDGWSYQMLTLKIGTRWGPVLFVALSPIICGFTTINHIVNLVICDNFAIVWRPHLELNMGYTEEWPRRKGKWGSTINIRGYFQTNLYETQPRVRFFDQKMDLYQYP